MMCSSLSTAANFSCMQLYYDICGNAPLEQAKIVIITSDYNNPDNIKKNADLINQIWRAQLVLVEDIPFGEIIKPEQHPFSKGIHRNIPIKGWDVSNFKMQNDILDKREKAINELAKCIQEDLQKERYEVFNLENGSLATLLTYSENVEEKKKDIREHLAEGRHHEFVSSVHEAIRVVKRDHQQRLYTLYSSVWQSRLSSLINAMEHGIESHRKVIVLASGSLVIPNPQLKDLEFDLSKITNYLSDSKFAILNPKHSSLRIANQFELWPQSKKENLALAAPNNESSRIISPQPQRALVSNSLSTQRTDAANKALLQIETREGLKLKLPSQRASKYVLGPLFEEEEEGVESANSPSKAT